MICSRCGAQMPDHCKFCVQCGNRMNAEPPSEKPQPDQQPVQQQVNQQPAQPPKQASSGSGPFDKKQISDRHYSLEEIARQQEEKSNEIGLAGPQPEKRRKKTRPEQEQSLPGTARACQG